uniref:Predicted protein n=1 Tax=Hordeum vulgare subsp. vulgare TaxID=112509 RepID=F2E9G8_HORVV|nr:predicted protein [Hordeum vulgare subsp. vulgare]
MIPRRSTVEILYVFSYCNNVYGVVRGRTASGALHVASDPLSRTVGRFR